MTLRGRNWSYAWVPAHRPGLDPRWIWPRRPSEPVRTYTTTLQKHDLHRALANSALIEGDDGILSFVEEWGLLRSSPHGVFAHWVADFLVDREQVLKVMRGEVVPSSYELNDPPNHWGLTLDLHKERGKPVIRLKATSLSQFCLLEWFHAHTTGIRYSVCGYCGVFLPAQKVGRPKLYCDSKHKQAAHRRDNPAANTASNERRRKKRAAGRKARKPSR